MLVSAIKIKIQNLLFFSLGHNAKVGRFYDKQLSSKPLNFLKCIFNKFWHCEKTEACPLVLLCNTLMKVVKFCLFFCYVFWRPMHLSNNSCTVFLIHFLIHFYSFVCDIFMVYVWASVQTPQVEYLLLSISTLLFCIEQVSLTEPGVYPFV